MEAFAQIPLSDWGYEAPNFGPNEIAERLAAETRMAAACYKLLAIELETATDPQHLEFQRVSAAIPISPELFDAWFSGAGGYRAQYAMSEREGERFNRLIIEPIAAVLAGLEDLYAGSFDRDFCERSLAGAHTKVWVSTDVSDVASEAWLAGLPEVIGHKPWLDWWGRKERPRKGLLAPSPDEPAVLVRGTFLRTRDGAAWDQKPYRSLELHRKGWT